MNATKTPKHEYININSTSLTIGGIGEETEMIDWTDIKSKHCSSIMKVSSIIFPALRNIYSVI